jgi:MFS family permease
MSRKQLTLLLILNFGPFAVGNSLLSLMPIYTKQLGADSAITGFYLASAFGALALGTFSSGWLSAHLGRQKYLIASAAAVSVPATFLMGQAETLVVLAIFTLIVWFMSGIQLSLVTILVGMNAGKSQRGRAFGIIGTGRAMAQLLGGLAAGPLVDHWGFSALFLANTLLFTVMVVVALLLEERPHVSESSAASAATSSVLVASTAFILILAAWGLVNVANFVSVLGKPLAMNDQGFSSTAITSTFAISGAVNLPLPFVMGWLSDRFGRKQTLMIAYFAGAIGLGILTQATALWHFAVAQIFITAVGSGMAVGAALITDVVHPEALSGSLARYGMARWVGGIIGYLATGVSIQTLGLPVTFMIGSILPLGAVLLVWGVGMCNLPQSPAGDPQSVFSPTELVPTRSS